MTTYFTIALERIVGWLLVNSASTNWDSCTLHKPSTFFNLTSYVYIKFINNLLSYLSLQLKFRQYSKLIIIHSVSATKIALRHRVNVNIIKIPF